MADLWKSRLILCPTDFSDQAEAAFDLSCSLARDRGARVIVLHVVPPPAAYGEIVARRPETGFWDDMRSLLHGIKPADPAVSVEYRLEQGDPAVVIGHTADALGCDLIVMGTHGRTALGRLFLGSVAEKVLRECGPPVLTVKASAAGRRADAVEPAVAAGI
jgi:nucleotide-binding universal stress UspA family protein